MTRPNRTARVSPLDRRRGLVRKMGIAATAAVFAPTGLEGTGFAAVDLTPAPDGLSLDGIAAEIALQF